MGVTPELQTYSPQGEIVVSPVPLAEKCTEVIKTLAEMASADTVAVVTVVDINEKPHTFNAAHLECVEPTGEAGEARIVFKDTKNRRRQRKLAAIGAATFTLAAVGGVAGAKYIHTRSENKKRPPRQKA